MNKFYESEGMKSVGEATAKEVRDGKYSAEFNEPEETFDTWLADQKEKDNFGGSVGRPEGEER